ncbi:hypothetical protein CL673_04380 [Candidatus Bathyarchaeota archaeon]|jgi:hypothetical protein|nr:hypothetical protein [Candidatus Bathyarchaeota archaeon]
MKYDVTKIIPKKVPGANQVVRTGFKLRWEMCNKMKEVDPDVNFYSIRPLSHEFVNFADGKLTIDEVAAAVGYEYGLQIKGEHVLLLFKDLKEKGFFTFSQKD